MTPCRIALLKAQTALNTQPSFDPATAKGAVRAAISDYTALVLLPRLMQVLAAGSTPISRRLRPALPL